MNKQKPHPMSSGQALVHKISCRRYPAGANNVPACRSDCPCDGQKNTDETVEELIGALRACRSELHCMIDRHNTRNDSESWVYDYQTVSRADEAIASYLAKQATTK